MPAIFVHSSDRQGKSHKYRLILLEKPIQIQIIPPDVPCGLFDLFRRVELNFKIVQDFLPAFDLTHMLVKWHAISKYILELFNFLR